ncbi:MAG: CopG family transcriptional regulator [Candidatus Micrarchaeota archaeon]|nr:CopG family transcriptional regulator [Candidatus Micrarchaeota archaeon]
MTRTRTQERRKYTTITIPSPLFDNIKKKIENTGFSSVSDYATFVLRETVADLVIEKSGKRNSRDSAIMNKLKALGYM